MNLQNTIVAKFGGSSLADAGQFEKVKYIIDSDVNRRFVIPSAPGKRSKEDIKITDLLYSCYYNVSNPEQFDLYFGKIKARYQEIIDTLGLSVSLTEEFEKIHAAFLNGSGEEYAASRGEYLNGILVADYLGFTFVDAADVIRFDESGVLDSEVTNKLLRNRLSKTEKAVIPGFYGADQNGTIHTFSRGGSDVTGSLVARGVEAVMYENWTDVSGFLVTDPSIVDHPKKVDRMTFAELRELSYRGATVLHEDAVYPARREGIPIHIRNTNKPLENGTLICRDVAPEDAMPITGIAGKKNFVAINLAKNGLNSQTNSYRKLLEVIDENHIVTEHMPCGIDTTSIILQKADYDLKKGAIIASIHSKLQPDSIKVDEDLAMVTVVGKGMRAVSGIAGRFFYALSNADVNIKMIDMGSNEMNCTIGVSNEDFEKAIRALYNALA